jgi:uncharacterized RDD family membrane protein YckC
MTGSTGPGGESRRDPSSADPSFQSEGQNKVVIERIDFSKRVVALIIDVFVAYLLSIVVSLVPFLGKFLPMQATMVLYLLSRDFFFEGRGVGKNVMGLRVVDVRSGLAPTLFQSFERNVIFLAPFIVLECVQLLLHFIPIPWLNDAVVNLITIVGMVYVAVVIPMEAYRAYSRADGLRIGDEIAGTTIVEAPMDFSNIVPRQK